MKEEFWELKLEEEKQFEEGNCQKCGEPLNNAEGYLCFKCKVAEAEYHKD